MVYYSKGFWSKEITRQGQGLVNQRKTFDGRLEAYLQTRQISQMFFYSQEYVCQVDARPENVLIRENGDIALIDFGGVETYFHKTTSSWTIRSNSRTSMSYWAPELCDINTRSTGSNQVGIWSLGCTLFATMYGYSPFEIPVEKSLVGDI